MVPSAPESGDGWLKSDEGDGMIMPDEEFVVVAGCCRLDRVD